MATREEIREGIKYQIAQGGGADMMVWNIVRYLHNNGVVRKVERELPRAYGFVPYTADFGEGYSRGLRDIQDMGYVAVEPLIED